MDKPSKVLECGTIISGCNFVARADSADELMIVAAAHANSVHGVDHLSEPLKAKIHSVIRDA